jgi:G3E family GTPase
MLHCQVFPLRETDVRDVGIVAIENLMKKKGNFDYILLETTGLADPGPIASMFWLDDSLGASIYLDGIITVVDSVNIDRSLNTHDNEEHHMSTAHLQISHADVLLVNKVDLVPKSTKTTVLERIQSINSLAKVHETEYARIESLETILDLHAYDEANLPVDEFNRDSSGHLDHVLPLVATNESIYQPSPFNSLHCQRCNGIALTRGYNHCFGKGRYRTYHLSIYQCIERKDGYSHKTVKSGYYKA